jgi:oligopeptide/dipeptide ABC transporter ATP-binding protein
MLASQERHIMNTISTASTIPAASAELCQVENLKTYFPGPPTGALPWSKRAVVRAVDGISFAIRRGETLGLVGESGCGKSTVARSILQLIRPTEGAVYFEGQNLCRLKEHQLHPLRRHMQIIFQDPYASLDPRCTVGFTIGEGLLIHKLATPAEAREHVAELMKIVGLNPALQNRYPHEFSGGQRQRVGIARALATSPTFVIGDEPISALDVSIQAQIINLLRDLRDRLQLTMLFISHDLRAVRFVSEQVAVMYLGKIVEIGQTDQIFGTPQHPYTQALLRSVPIPRWKAEKHERAVLRGEIPSPLAHPKGCPFAARCPHVMARCRDEHPALVDVAPGQKVACFLVHNIADIGSRDATNS